MGHPAVVVVHPYVRMPHLPMLEDGACYDYCLLVVAFDQIRGVWLQIAEETSAAVIWASGEVHLCCWCSGYILVRRGCVPEANAPDSVDGDRLAAGVFQKPIELAGCEIVGRDVAAGLG